MVYLPPNESTLTKKFFDMKDKIALAVKTKYQRFGLTNEAIDRIALAKEKTVTSEADIDSAIADAETMTLIATEIQKMRDAEIQKRTDTQRAFDTYKEKHPATDPTPPTPPNPKEGEEPEWAKKLREQNEALTARLDAQDKAAAAKATRLTVESKLKAEGCTNAGILNLTLKGFALGENETMEAAVARLKEEYNASCKEAFGDNPRPIVGDPAFGDPKAAITHKNDFLREQGLLPKEK